MFAVTKCRKSSWSVSFIEHSTYTTSTCRDTYGKQGTNYIKLDIWVRKPVHYKPWWLLGWKIFRKFLKIIETSFVTQNVTNDNVPALVLKNGVVCLWNQTRFKLKVRLLWIKTVHFQRSHQVELQNWYKFKPVSNSDICRRAFKNKGMAS